MKGNSNLFPLLTAIVGSHILPEPTGNFYIDLFVKCIFPIIVHLLTKKK